MDQFRTKGKTVVFVSYDLDTVKEMCQRSMLLREGRIASVGDTEKVVNDYLALLKRGTT